MRANPSPISTPIPISAPIATEDPTIKIAWCKSEAQIVAEEQNRRYRNAVGVEVLKCQSDPSCNSDSVLSVVYDVEGAIKRSYGNLYNSCLEFTKDEFVASNNRMESYWQACETKLPGYVSMDLYLSRQKCVIEMYK